MEIVDSCTAESPRSNRERRARWPCKSGRRSWWAVTWVFAHAWIIKVKVYPRRGAAQRARTCPAHGQSARTFAPSKVRRIAMTSASIRLFSLEISIVVDRRSIFFTSRRPRNGALGMLRAISDEEETKKKKTEKKLLQFTSDRLFIVEPFV